MADNKCPEAWYWSYDIKPDEIDSVLVPGVRLIRLSSYRKGTSPRFAALAFKDGGPARRHVHDLDAVAAEKLVADTGERPVAITVDAATTSGDAPRFSLVLETGPGPLSTLRTNLDEAGLRAALDGHRGVADLATYVAGGVRRYAAIIVEDAGPSWLFAGITSHELDAKLIEHGAALVRLRSYAEAGRQLFVAVAERAGAQPWAWYPALDADGVARELERNNAYPLDLDATRDDQGLRFSVVMYRDTQPE